MKNLSITLIFFIVLGWNSNCRNHEQVASVNDKGFPPVKVDNIKVRLLGKSSNLDDDLLKIITEPKEIQALIKFTDHELSDKSNWRPEYDKEKGIFSPHHFINLVFYEGEDFERVFGVGGGRYKVEEYFFSSIDSNNDYKIKYVSRATFLEFLQLIGLSEEEWGKFQKEFDQPGPWKKKS